MLQVSRLVLIWADSPRIRHHQYAHGLLTGARATGWVKGWHSKRCEDASSGFHSVRGFNQISVPPVDETR